jgi:hypothetical protein
VSATIAQPITGPMVWRGEDLTRSTDWIRAITSTEVEELDGALRAVQGRGLDWRNMTRDDFPLPRFSRSLAEVGRELEDGRGLVLLRRIPVERYSEDELRIIYWGLGLHLGTPRYQNPDGELIGDVRDENRLYGAVREAVPGGETRSSRNKARSAGPLRFHTDRVDVVTLLCVRPAATGGLSKVASAVAVHNAILERRPDLHALLCEPYYHTRQGEAGGELKYYAMPLFARPRRAVHQPVLPHVRRGRPAHPRGAAHDGGPGRRARSVGRGVRGALPHHGHPARRHPAPEQPRRVSRPHHLRGRPEARP